MKNAIAVEGVAVRDLVRQPGHDPEKCEAVSRLREALGQAFCGPDALAGEGRSEKIMPKQEAKARGTIRPGLRRQAAGRREPADHIAITPRSHPGHDPETRA